MSLVSGSTVPYIATDQLLVDQIVYELKSQGIFDSFRKECIADVDTKPAYQNLRQRVEGSVSSFLKEQKWKPESNKNQLRDMLRKNIYESGFLETGVERIVNQVVNPKINTVFLPKVKEVFYKHIGLQTPAANDFPDAEEQTKTETEPQNLLPTDLEAISPENIQETAQEDSNSMAVDDDDTSPPFEPLDEDFAFKLIPMEENSIDSHLSGMSGLASHDSQHSNKDNMQQLLESDSQLSKNSSSDDRLSIVTDEASNTKVDMLVVTDGVVALETSDDNKDNKDNISELTRQETKAKVPTNDLEDKTIIKDELIILDVQIKQETPEEDTKTSLSSDSNVIKQDDTSSKHNSSHKKDSSRDNKKDSSRHHSTSKSRDKSRDSKDYRDSKDKSSKIKSATSSSTTKDISKSKSSSTPSSSSRHSSDKDKERISTTKKYSSTSSKDKDKSSTNITKDKSNGSSKDKSKDKDSSASGSKDKYKDHSSKSSTSSSRDKSSSKDHSKSKSTDKSYKSEHRSSSSRKYSTSNTTETSKSHTPSSSNKDKRDRKENTTKDDHFSSKTQRNERRSTDRDSNDGQTKSYGGSTSNCGIGVLPPSEEHTNNNTTEDSSSNNSNSKDGSNSDCCQNGGGTKIVPDNGQTEIQQPVDLLSELQKQENKLLETVPENNDISLLETTESTTTTLMESTSPDFVETLDAIKSHLAEYKPADEPKEVLHIAPAVRPMSEDPPTEVLPLIKLPKFASNFREVRKIMKLRKQLKQQSKLRKLLLTENSTDSASTEQVNNKAAIKHQNTNHNASLVLLEQDLSNESTAIGITGGTAKEELIKISNNDDCLYLDEVTDKTTRYLSYTSSFIDKLNNEVSVSTQNKVPVTKRRGKKRKISTLSSDSSSTYNDITADQLSTSSILSRNTTLSPIATSTEINSTTTTSSSSGGDAAAVTSATAHVHVVKQRRLTNSKATQRYTSDDLYKPRPFLKGTTKRTSGRVAN